MARPKPSGERAHEISFQQFRQFCVLLPATNTMQLFEYFEGNLGIDVTMEVLVQDWKENT